MDVRRRHHGKADGAKFRRFPNTWHGLLAIDGMNRGPNNNTGFGLIPVRPISYSDAMHLLRLLKGKNFICKTQDMFRQLFFNDYLA